MPAGVIIQFDLESDDRGFLIRYEGDSEDREHNKKGPSSNGTSAEATSRASHRPNFLLPAAVFGIGSNVTRKSNQTTAA